MPAAVQLCRGAMRLVPIKRFKPDDKVDCPTCNARPKCERRVFNAGRDLYYEVPSHRANGVREAATVDWSQV